MPLPSAWNEGFHGRRFRSPAFARARRNGTRPPNISSRALRPWMIDCGSRRPRLPAPMRLRSTSATRSSMRMLRADCFSVCSGAAQCHHTAQATLASDCALSLAGGATRWACVRWKRTAPSIRPRANESTVVVIGELSLAGRDPWCVNILIGSVFAKGRDGSCWC